MHTIYSIQKHALIPLSMLILLVFLLSACGAASTSTGGGNTAGSGSATAPVSVKGYGSTNGCPSDMVVATGTSSRANITLQPSDANTTVTAHNGDVIEIRLPFGHKWNGPAISQGVLQLQSPAGYASKTNSVCVWRFVAQGTGNVNLNFTGQALCKKGQVCPMFIMAVPFKIDVK